MKANHQVSEKMIRNSEAGKRWCARMIIFYIYTIYYYTGWFT